MQEPIVPAAGPESLNVWAPLASPALNFAALPLQALQSLLDPGDYPGPTTPAATPQQAAHGASKAAAAVGPDPLHYPPGFVGELAKYIYETSPRPVREIAIVAALGFMAGVLGRSFTVNGSAVNLYLNLVGRSAIGKEAIPKGIARLLDALCPQDGPMLAPGAPPLMPTARDHVHFGDVSSGPALRRLVAEKLMRSFVWVAGEWGQYLSQMALGVKAAPHVATVKRAMLDLYDKGDTDGVASAVAYAKREDNIASVRGVAMSFIGTSTPGTYWSALTEQMAEDGFLSRFVTIEHHGPRPDLQKNCDRPLDESQLAHLRHILTRVAQLFAQGRAQHAVGTAHDALSALDEYDCDCTDAINATNEEGTRQAYNRAHLNAWRIAGVLAAADSPEAPQITIHHFEWARHVVDVGIDNWISRQAAGEIGEGDDVRQRKLGNILRQFLTQALPPSYGMPSSMQRDAVVPRKYLQIRTSKDTAFTKHQLGHKRALDDAITTLCDNGHMAEMDKTKAGELYTFQGRCFRIVSLPK